MKSIRSHLSLTIALFSIIFTVQLFMVVLRLIDAYEIKLKNSYSMILISHAKLEKKQLNSISHDITSLKIISSDTILQELSDDLDEKQQTMLKATLPNFYELKLGHFPDPKEIDAIQKKLLKVQGVFQVESFSSRHDQIYKLLLLLKSVVNVFGLLVIVIAILVILKEMRLWQFHHHDRMHIMGLFGSPVWLRSAVLFKFAVIDAVIASLLVIGGFYYLQHEPYILGLMQSIDISTTLIYPFKEGSMLLGIALFTSLSLALSLVFQKDSSH